MAPYSSSEVSRRHLTSKRGSEETLFTLDSQRVHPLQTVHAGVFSSTAAAALKKYKYRLFKSVLDLLESPAASAVQQNAATLFYCEAPEIICGLRHFICLYISVERTVPLILLNYPVQEEVMHFW